MTVPSYSGSAHDDVEIDVDVLEKDLCTKESSNSCGNINNAAVDKVGGGSTSTSTSSVENNNNNLVNEIEQANRLYKKKIIIQDTNSRGWGLYSECDYTIGQLVMISYPMSNVRHIKDSHTIQYDTNKHAHISLPARFVNHICGIANLGIKIIITPTDTGCTNDREEIDINTNTTDNTTTMSHYTDVIFKFYAIQPIQKGQELLWDYETTEYDMETKFNCTCGSVLCRGTLRGYRYNSTNVLQCYSTDWIASYLLL